MPLSQDKRDFVRGWARIKVWETGEVLISEEMIDKLISEKSADVKIDPQLQSVRGSIVEPLCDEAPVFNWLIHREREKATIGR